MLFLQAAFLSQGEEVRNVTTAFGFCSHGPVPQLASGHLLQASFRRQVSVFAGIVQKRRRADAVLHQLRSFRQDEDGSLDSRSRLEKIQWPDG